MTRALEELIDYLGLESHLMRPTTRTTLRGLTGTHRKSVDVSSREGSLEEEGLKAFFISTEMYLTKPAC